MGDDRDVPAGVWIFWTIFALFILGLVGTGYPTFGGAFSFLISILSALGGGIAAVAAYFTVREMRHDREDERRHRRPYFSASHSEIGLAWIDEDEEADSIHIRCYQVGINPAADVKAKAEIIEAHNLRVLTTLIYEAVDEYPTQAVFTFNKTDHFLVNSFRHHYVVFKLEYKDAIYQTQYEQTFYFQWSGLGDPGNKRSGLHPISQEILSLIRRPR